MIKKHLKCYIYATYKINIFEVATEGPKENLRTYQRKSRYERKPALIKLLTLLNYWSNHMEKLIAAVKIFLLT